MTTFIPLYGTVCLLLFAALLSLSASTEPAEPNYDEALVPQFELPDPLIAEDGAKIETPEEWREIRRPEILKLFKEHMFGQFPEANLSNVRFEEIISVPDALDGKATRKEIKIFFDSPNDEPQATVLLYVPNEREGKAPVFVMPNFYGVQTTTDDPGVSAYRIENSTHLPDKTPEETRGFVKSRWPFDMIISRGYAVATVCYEEIEPDAYRDVTHDVDPFLTIFRQGVHPLFTNFDPNADDYPATIGAWAWGLSRVLDMLETVPEIDATKAIIAGHSRLGKTALWCGANDERFAAVISNNSGCGGSALSRRQFGECIDLLNYVRPHWFTKKFHEYNDKVNELPIDEHELIALIAPRPVYIASATEDLPADPKGEFLAAFYADPVYRLLGTDGFGDVTEQPGPDTPVGATIRYHLRTGKHDVTDYDWEQYLNFADSIFNK
ncbi:MAG: acetylxylan esterase [Thermoguttaceae bacterium]